MGQAVAADGRRRAIGFAMNVVVNGETRPLPEGASVSELVKALGLERAACAVEVNRKLVPKPKHEEHRLADGDSVEVVTLVGGG